MFAVMLQQLPKSRESWYSYLWNAKAGEIDHMAIVMTLEEVADYLKVHSSTIYRMLKDKRIPAFKLGSDWRFNRDSIERWLEAMEADRATESREISVPLRQPSPRQPVPSVGGPRSSDSAK
jgi:excisionase family DNA binding protein